VSVAYTEIHISISDTEQDLLLAELMDTEFDSVWQKEEELIIYFQSDLLNADKFNQIEAVCKSLGLELWVLDSEQKNWNKLWEENFDPVTIMDFCYIYAAFHTDHTDCKHKIKIDPKMAFGTAHHPTTYMMIETMADLNFKEKTVFDFGCGTAILAVLAEKLGAKKTIALDYDENAVSNSLEHLEINQSKSIEVKQGDIDQLPQIGNFDIVLANINRSVLLTTAKQLFQNLNQNGELLLSGILETDHQLIKEAYTTAGFTYVYVKKMNDWLCYRFKKG